ncbi:MAG: hypothetical protein E6K70_21010 [Planctomycetota bacterium]|nr:MAG: hypothetical protein E6K70_21010 [Planctomycetota bacterium]
MRGERHPTIRPVLLKSLPFWVAPLAAALHRRDLPCSQPICLAGFFQACRMPLHGKTVRTDTDRIGILAELPAVSSKGRASKSGFPVCLAIQQVDRFQTGETLVPIAGKNAEIARSMP